MKIGSWFKDCDKIQKSVRTDPNPQIPFCDAKAPFDRVEKVVSVGIVIFVSITIISMWMVL